VAADLADVIIVTSEDPRGEDAVAIIAEIAKGAELAGAQPGTRLFCRADRREAIGLALEMARTGDCILLAGKGHEGSIIWGREKVPWDEAQTARELLAELGYTAR
jgi:UDP-N-acetylmuramoyl-L-alanyl-D-glutamate--2,6-diaminopimelate ligase